MMFVARNQKTLKRIGSFKITIGHMLRRNSSAKNALLFGLVAQKTLSTPRSTVGTESEGEGLLRAVVHTNAYNI